MKLNKSIPDMKDGCNAWQIINGHNYINDVIT